MVPIRFFACYALLALVSAKAATTWTGATSNDFTVGTNWSAGVPTGQDAIFDVSAGSITPSLLTNFTGQTLTVTGANTATLTIDPSATLNLSNTTSLYTGRVTDGATLNVNGGGTLSIINSPASSGFNSFNVGRNTGAAVTSGTLNINGASKMTFDQAPIALLNVGVGYTGGVEAQGTTGTVHQFGTSGVTLGSNFELGYNGGVGNYTLHDNATLVSGSAAPFAFIYIGANDSTHDGGQQFTATSGTLTLLDHSTMTLGTGGTQVYLKVGDNIDTSGVNAGAGLISQEGNSTVTLGANSNLSIGNAAGGTGAYNLKDSATLNVADNLLFGLGANAGANGVFNQSGGTLTSAATFQVGISGTGTYTMTGGTSTLTKGLALGASGTLNLNGGTLQVGGSNGLTGTAGSQVNFGAGQIQVIGSALSTAVDIKTLTGTTSTINTNGLGATLSGVITTTGTRQVDDGGNGFVKAGAGTLTLSGTSRAFNTFVSTAGTTAQTAGATTVSEFMVGSGAGSTSDFVMSGGSITIAQAPTANPLVMRAGSFRIGDFSGAGTFTQTGGTVTGLTNTAFNIGNQGGTGVYNLQGGDLVLGGLLNTLARSAVGKPISDGTLNVSGGKLTIQNGANLILSNSLGGATLGAGRLNQTGGTVTVTNDSTLYIAGYGDGTYNLSAGTLEVGGATSLSAHYPGSNASYHFNLGGGELKVRDTALATSVDATLGTGITSTVNTAGLGATLSGAISGSGNLVKQGGGTLTLSGANGYTGTTTVAVGKLTVQSTTGTGAVTVQSGAELSGTGTVAGPASILGTLSSQSLTFTSGLTLADLSQITLNIGGYLPGQFDAVHLASGVLTYNGTLTLALGAGMASPGSSILFDMTGGATEVGDFDAVVTTGLAGVILTRSGNLWSGASGALTFNQTTGVLTVQGVPEPSTWAALLVGVSVLAVVGRRKYRRA